LTGKRLKTTFSPDLLILRGTATLERHRKGQTFTLYYILYSRIAIAALVWAIATTMHTSTRTTDLATRTSRNLRQPRRPRPLTSPSIPLASARGRAKPRPDSLGTARVPRSCACKLPDGSYAHCASVVAGFQQQSSSAPIRSTRIGSNVCRLCKASRMEQVVRACRSRLRSQTCGMTRMKRRSRRRCDRVAT